MKILKVYEPEGDEKCVRMDCEFEEDEVEILLSYAVTNILKDQLKRMEVDCEHGTSGYDREIHSKETPES